MKINLAEELLLLAYDDAGSPAISGQSVDCGLAGALLMELMLAGRVEVADRRVVVVDARPTDDPVVDEALARIGADRRKPQDWVNRLSKGLRDRLLHRMVETGVLRREQDKVLWVFPRTRYPSTTGAQPAPETETRHRLHAAVNGDGAVDPRTAALCALVRAVRLEGTVFPGLPKKQVRNRLKTISAASWRSQQAATALDAAQVISLAQAARRDEDRLASPMRAAIRVQEAYGHALDGNSRVAQQLLDHAHRWAAHDTTGDARGGHGSFCTPSYIEIRRAGCLLTLRQAKSAITLYETALPKLPAVYQRDRAAALVQLAAAYAADGQPEPAAHSARLALPVARTAGSRRIVGQVARLAKTLVPYREQPGVTELLDELNKSEA